MKCPSCHTIEAAIDPYIGAIPCLDCRKRQQYYIKGSKPIEFTSDSIKDQRQAFADDIEQPHRQGKLNKRWVEVYGKEAAKNQGYTETEIKQAEYVYNDIENGYYQKH